VHVETGPGKVRTFTVHADRVPDKRSNPLDVGTGGRSPEELTELAMRVSLCGEPNPLGLLGFMLEVNNPLPALESIGLSEDSIEQVAHLLLTEILIGERGVDHVTTFRLGRKHQGRRRLLLAWMPVRKYMNVDPVARRIEGEVVVADT
jgi:hypothetical protein